MLQAENEKLEKANKKLIEQKQVPTVSFLILNVTVNSLLVLPFKEVLVQSNLLKVEIKRLEDTLNAKSEEVVSVGQEKETLSLVLKTSKHLLLQLLYTVIIYYSGSTYSSARNSCQEGTAPSGILSIGRGKKKDEYSVQRIVE